MNKKSPEFGSIGIIAFALIMTLIRAGWAEDGVNKNYFIPARSYSTTRDPDLPKYSRNGTETPLKSLFSADSAVPADLKWLDIGLDYRMRYEYRDNDFRARSSGRDTPLFHRTRFYLGMRELADPFRAAFEVQDSRRTGGDLSRPVPEGDEVNPLAIIRLYGELFWKDLFGKDPRGNSRPLSLRYGIHNFEFLDRRLIGNNQWRNTANTFQGFHGALGQESNDWQVDLLALQPINRVQRGWDRPIDPKFLYGLIGHWRGWSSFITIEPFYLQFRQSRYIGLDGKANAERLLHIPGVRTYGVFGKSGVDFDFGFIPQIGSKGAITAADLGPANQASKDTRAAEKVLALGVNAELGYTWEETTWKPRLSVFYGYASGDRRANPELDGTGPVAPGYDTTDHRFERLYGFQRPWSASDYMVYENISSPKLRLEARPTKDLRVDLGQSWYWLASGTDRFFRANAGTGTSRDYFQKGGSFIGQEWDLRVRYNWGQKTEITSGYSHFAPGRFLKTNVRDGGSHFGYLEWNYRLF